MRACVLSLSIGVLVGVVTHFECALASMTPWAAGALYNDTGICLLDRGRAGGIEETCPRGGVARGPFESAEVMSSDLSQPPAPAEGSSPAANAFLAGGGEMGALMRAKSWGDTPLGPPETWPDALKMVVSICLNSRFPISLWWGAELVMLYNDAWRPILAETSPAQRFHGRSRSDA